MLYRAQFPTSIFSEFDRLQREMQQTFEFLPNIRGRLWGTYPAINVGRSSKSVDVFVFVPGVDAKQIEVQLEQGVLVVAGQREIPEPDQEKEAVMHIDERFSGRFRRVITLPEDIDPEQVEANYRDGVLHICIQRKAATTPRQITIH
jgi:HSP20 family protein